MALQIGAKTRVLMAMRKEAKARGLSVQKYMGTASHQELIALIRQVDPTVNPAEIVPGLPDIPPVDVTRWGMPPEAALSTDLSRPVPVVGAAVAAARAGDWRPAADLLERSYGDWAMRSVAVHALGEAAADDGAWMRAWRATAGENRHFAAVEAHGLLWLGWKLRGSRPGEETSPMQHDAFFQTLRRSEAASHRAIELAPDDPTPWSTLITLARGLSYDPDQFAAHWRELQARDPLHRTGHEFALMYWSPEDGPGSYDSLFAFADRAAAASPSLAFLVLQAAFDYEARDENIWRDAMVQRALDLVLRWLSTPAGGGGVFADSDRRWAAYALVSAGRGAEAVPLFAHLGVDASGRPWEDYNDDAAAVFDSFRRRACAAVRS
ncbi:DUF4034 domain-containing protein [Glycomyces harbinensis]|uniref:DUF4034 domain-containing protein n=1 Tax=Glycomyces harbinensis TaxID=58114 RepID=A0A1G7ABS3_9ACTN|nr:DUF4034 domain-containing protein [Glycomyces harbinensis]SDE12249.1 hypothetical protein SAMN05216270_11351 [Glycomyces harbinensis]